jgi:hypothetical protein
MHKFSRSLLIVVWAMLFVLSVEITPSGHGAVAGSLTHEDAIAPPPLVSGDNVVTQWNQAALQAVRNTRLGPPMVARALAVVHTCIYDAWAAYDADAVGTRFGGILRRPPEERTLINKERAISYAAYRALTDLFPASQAPMFEGLMRSLGYDPADASTNPANPAGVGNLAAAAVIAFRHHDGANQLGDLSPGAYSDYTDYRPVNTCDLVNDPDRWQPLRLPDGQVQRIAWEAIKQGYEEGEKQISCETIQDVIAPDFRDIRTELKRLGYTARDIAYDYGYSTKQVNRFLDGKLPADDPAGR